MLPSLEQHEGPRKKPRVLVLEVQDRQKPDGPVIAQLLIERQESFKYYADGPLEEAGFELSYRMVGADVFPGNGRGEFRAGFSTFDNRVSVTGCPQDSDFYVRKRRACQVWVWTVTGKALGMMQPTLI
ncbi:hypothetical protein J2794_005783 [Paraburkholderia terricola]|nr:hypothetical protein [Paraburkholderia terricola]